MAYTNSPLVTYTNVTQYNKTSPRNHAIDTITIHCYVGQVTAKRGCDSFARESKKVSAQYVVGYDGSIGLSCDEKDRAWTTGGYDSNGNPIYVNGISGSMNDHRAVTIECASETKSPYKVTDEAYNALIDLCEDICRRNGIPKLLWKADKSLVGKIDQQNMTVHRWFARKSCPGDYLYGKMGDIADAVNARLGTGGGSNIPEYARYIWDYFLTKIGNEYGVAGLMGNLANESGLHPDRLQGDIPYSSASQEYTAKVDSGEISEYDFVHNGPGGGGYGLAQWTYYTRKQALYNMWKSGGYSSIGSIELACDYLWYELENDYPGVLTTLKNATSVREASDKVLHDFERPSDQSESVEEGRAEKGVYYYNLFANGGTGGNPPGGTTPDEPQGGTHQRKMSKLLLYMVATDRY